MGWYGCAEGRGAEKVRNHISKSLIVFEGCCWYHSNKNGEIWWCGWVLARNPNLRAFSQTQNQSAGGTFLQDLFIHYYCLKSLKLPLAPKNGVK